MLSPSGRTSAPACGASHGRPWRTVLVSGGITADGAISALPLRLSGTRIPAALRRDAFPPAGRATAVATMDSRPIRGRPTPQNGRQRDLVALRLRSGTFGRIARCVQSQRKFAVPQPWSLVAQTETPRSTTRLRRTPLIYRICKGGRPLCACLVIDVSPRLQVRCFVAPVLGAALTPVTPLIAFGFDPVRVSDFGKDAAGEMLQALFAALQNWRLWAMW